MTLITKIPSFHNILFFHDSPSLGLCVTGGKASGVKRSWKPLRLKLTFTTGEMLYMWQPLLGSGMAWNKKDKNIIVFLHFQIFFLSLFLSF